MKSLFSLALLSSSLFLQPEVSSKAVYELLNSEELGNLVDHREGSRHHPYMMNLASQQTPQRQGKKRLSLDEGVKQQIERDLLNLGQIVPKKENAAQTEKNLHILDPDHQPVNFRKESSKLLKDPLKAEKTKSRGQQPLKDDKLSKLDQTQKTETAQTSPISPQKAEKPSPVVSEGHQEDLKEVEQAGDMTQPLIVESALAAERSRHAEEEVHDLAHAVADHKRKVEYEEMLDDEEQRNLHKMIRWLSIEQTIMFGCLFAVVLAFLIVLILRICNRRESSRQIDSQVLQQQQLLASTQSEDSLFQKRNMGGPQDTQQSPVNFNNLRRKIESGKMKNYPGRAAIGNNSFDRKFRLNQLPDSGSKDKNYEYEDDTPSFRK